MYRQYCFPGTEPYEVRPGDTLYQIASKYNTTVLALIFVNPQINPNMLQVGQTICVPIRPTYPTCPNGKTYTVRPGDTLYGIARDNNISLYELMEANPRLNPYMLEVGSVICIPSVPAPPPVDCAEGTPYTIASGDTFYKIANDKNVSLDDLLQANPDLDPDKLQVGQTICIPQEPPMEGCPQNAEEYTIKSGDTFYKIATAKNTTVAVLRRLNPNVNPNALTIGQTICVPKAVLPNTKEIPVTIGGVTENRPAVLQRSPQNYYIYVLNNYKFTPEEPGKDQLYSTIDDSFFVRIEKLPGDADVDELKENAVTELREISAPVEISGNNIAIPFFRDSEFFLYATNQQITKNIVVMEIDGALFKFTMFFPSAEAAGEIVPGFYAMLQTIGIE